MYRATQHERLLTRRDVTDSEVRVYILASEVINGQDTRYGDTDIQLQVKGGIPTMPSSHGVSRSVWRPP